MTDAPFIPLDELAAADVRHGFFGRAGGVSRGIYASLNTGLGSSDDPSAVAENRARCAGALGLAPDRLLTLYQVHSAEVTIVEKPWRGQGPAADAMVTRQRGIALGVLTADCLPCLLVDDEAQVIGAAHAGWRGALAGILERTIDAMCGLGARPERIRAGFGPALRPPNFEVGLDLFDGFTEKYPASERFFAPGACAQKRQLDLAGFARWRLAERGVGSVADVGLCTLAAPSEYFSYRAARRRGECDYGRNLSAIALRTDGA